MDVTVAVFVEEPHIIVVELPVSGEIIEYCIPPAQAILSYPYTQYQYWVVAERKIELKDIAVPTLYIKPPNAEVPSV